MLVIFRVILGGNFSFYFNFWLENKTENPTLKKNSVVLMIEIKVFFYCCDKWRIRNWKFKRFTFWQNHLTGYTCNKLHLKKTQLFSCVKHAARICYWNWYYCLLFHSHRQEYLDYKQELGDIMIAVLKALM